MEIWRKMCPPFFFKFFETFVFWEWEGKRERRYLFSYFALDSGDFFFLPFF